ncbi:hypothetical protein C0J45_21759 [Silurus meridionalis]|nr:hypothetical protein C0J45_21759 [Silurus meridionalis]
MSSSPVVCCAKTYTGTEKHELTSWNSFKSIFRFFNEHLQTQMEVDRDDSKVEQLYEELKEEPNEEPNENRKEEQNEEESVELKEEQKEEEDDCSTTVTTQKCTEHEDL